MAGLARTTFAETTTIAAAFSGLMVRRPILLSVAGFFAASPTQPTRGRPVTTGTATPAGPRSVRGMSRWTTDCFAASSKMGSATSGLMKPAKSAVLIGAVMGMGISFAV